MIKFISNLKWNTPSALKNLLNNIEVKHQNNMVIRWGVSGEDHNEDNDIIINNGNALSVAVNKLNQLQILQDFQDEFMHVPKVWRVNDEDVRFPIIGRPVNHKKGLSFWILKNYNDIDRMNMLVKRRKTKKQCAEYYTELLDIKKEYRVHVFYDGINGRKFKVLRINEKVHSDNPRNERQAIVRSHRNGWIFKFARANDEQYDNIRKAARRAVKNLGLHFGAVDIGIDSEGKAYVFEVNTAPGLDNGGLERYSKFIQEQYINLNKWKEPIKNANA